MNVPAALRSMTVGTVLFLLPQASAAATLMPLRTQDAATLASGHVEVMLGASYFRNGRFPPFTPSNRLRSQHLVSAPEIGFSIAAGSWVEIQAAFDFLYLDETTTTGADHSAFGNGDARLWTKVRILRERQRWPALGVRFGAKLPNADKDERLGTDETDFGIEALASKQLGPVRAHVNLGLALLGNPGPAIGAADSSGEGQDDLFTYAVGLTSAALFGRPEGPTGLRGLAEVTGLAGSRFDNDRAAARLGLRYEYGGFAVYGAASAGFISASEDYGFSAGAIYTFALERLLGRPE